MVTFLKWIQIADFGVRAKVKKGLIVYKGRLNSKGFCVFHVKQCCFCENSEVFCSVMPCTLNFYKKSLDYL